MAKKRKKTKRVDFNFFEEYIKDYSQVIVNYSHPTLKSLGTSFLIHSRLPEGLTPTPKAYIPTVPAVYQKLGMEKHIKPIHPHPNKVIGVDFLATKLIGKFKEKTTIANVESIIIWMPSKIMPLIFTSDEYVALVAPMNEGERK